MPPSPEQATQGRLKVNQTKKDNAERRRDAVRFYLKARPGLSAEALAVMLSVSPSTIRGDWRVIKKT